MDWDLAYANGRFIAGADAYPARWATAAAVLRRGMGERMRADLPYGAGERERLDLFLPSDPPHGLVVFVHGGYWRSFGKSDWSHLAAGPLARGWAVAIPSYGLCPDVRIRDISRQIATAIGAAAELVRGPIRLVGHSAGGHLVARMVCSGSALPVAAQLRVRLVMPISGIFDLRPLLRTTMNEALRLDPGEARDESPALLDPETSAHLVCWVGADERPEFRRQSALLANVWSGLGASTLLVEDAGRHHFNVIDGLCEPDSALTQSLLAELG